jgi:trans-2,3-dihydro-3-hydroxyanthranilate isomerase
MHSAGLRIFTPVSEVPFAGHPTVGSAVFIALERSGNGQRDVMLALEVPAGLIRAVVELSGARSGYALFDAPKLPTDRGPAPDRDAVADALSLLPAEIGFENHQPSTFDAGISFIYVPVRNLEAIGRAAAHGETFARVFGGSGAYLYTRETSTVSRQFHARMFAPQFGIIEDPATGSGAVGLAGAIGRFDGFTAGTHRFAIEQGIEMGRPSLIALEVDSEAGAIHTIRLGGEAVVVGRGRLDIDRPGV